MSRPTPLRSFLGGIGLSTSLHSLLILNGSVLGVSGFIHRGVHGNIEALAGVGGLVLGGIAAGFIEGPATGLTLNTSPWTLLLSGILVGIGTKMSNGCTSGHMLAGVTRFSKRSIAATCTFFGAAVVTASLFHRDLPPSTVSDLSLGETGKTLLIAQAVPLALSILLYAFAPSSKLPEVKDKPASKESNPSLRPIASLLSGFEFALALRLSNLTDPIKVLSFLVLPFSDAFDPSLAYLALGALPLSVLLYARFRGPETPRLGGHWSIPKNGQIDARLISGSVLFGVGWGVSGICPGPGLVNFGQAVVSGIGLAPLAGWLGAFALGGLLV